MYALLDAHNFYCSCEQIMRPSLRSQPFVVLSSNDACVVSRSELARSMGVKMGVPWFQLYELEQKGLIGLSGNMQLYSDFSTRMHSLIAGLSPDVVQFSVDEAFACMNGIPGDHTERVLRLRERIQKWLGLPMGGGIGKTHTLAKLASHVSKAAFRKPGLYPSELAHVCNLAQLSAAQLDKIMAATVVGDVWGIGRRYSDQLYEAGVCTALDLKRYNVATARKRWGVTMERTIRELNGIDCITVAGSVRRDQIMQSRALKQPVANCAELEKIGALFATNTAKKLRLQGSMCACVNGFAMTSPFNKQERFVRSFSVPLVSPSDDTRTIVEAAVQGMRSIWESGHDIVKVGVCLVDLAPRSEALAQASFGFGLEQDSSPRALMQALDAINDRYGKQCVRVGAVAEKTLQLSKRERMTPNYTTKLSEVPIVRA